MSYFRTRDGAPVEDSEAAPGGVLRPGYGLRRSTMLMDAARPAGARPFLDAVPAGLPVTVRDALAAVAANPDADGIRRARQHIAGQARQLRWNASAGSLTADGAAAASAEATACDAALAWLDRAAEAVWPATQARIRDADDRAEAYRAASRDAYIERLARGES